MAKLYSDEINPEETHQIDIHVSAPVWPTIFAAIIGGIIGSLIGAGL